MLKAIPKVQGEPHIFRPILGGDTAIPIGEHHLVTRRRRRRKGHIHGGERLAIAVHIANAHQARHVVPIYFSDILGGEPGAGDEHSTIPERGRESTRNEMFCFVMT